MGRRLAARVILGVVGLGCGAVIAAYAWLLTDAGAGWLRRTLLAGVNASIEGRLAAGALRVRGLEIELTGVELRSPGGIPVARARRLRGLSLLALARRELVLESAELDGLQIELAAQDAGALLDAVRPRPQDQAGAGRLVVGAVEVREAAVRIVQGGAPGGPGAPRAWSVTGLTGALRHGARWSVALRGEEGAPARGAFSLEAALAAAGRQHSAHLELATPGAGAAGDVEWSGSALRLRIERAVIEPGLLRSLWRESPLVEPLRVSGVATLHETWWLALVASCAGRQYTVRGSGIALTRSGVEAGRVELALPGLSASGRGTWRDGLLDASADLSAPDVASAAAGLLAPFGARAPRVDGDVTLHVEVRGPSRDPAARVTARAGSLAWSARSVRQLSVEGSVAQLSAPWARALLELGGQDLVVDGRRVAQRWRIAATAERRVVEAALDTAGARLATARAVLGDDLAHATLRSASWRAGPLARGAHAGWRLTAPARLAWGPWGVRVERMALRAGDRALTVAGSLVSGRLAATARLSGLDLATLAPLLPGVPSPAGRLSGQVAATGPLRDPELSVDLAVVGGPLAALRDARLRVQARRARGGVTSAVAALSGDGLELRATLTSRGDPLRAGAATPVAMALRGRASLAELAASGLGHRLGRLPPALRGSASLALHGEGTLLRPELAGTLRLTSLSAAGAPPWDVDLAVRLGAARARAAGRAVQRDGQGALELEALVSRAAADAPVAVDGRLKGQVDLARPVSLGAGVRLAGVVALDLRAAGPLQEPALRGDVRLDRGALDAGSLGRLEDLSLAGRLDGHHVLIERLDARRAGGVLRASAAGEVDRDATSIRARGAIELRAFPVVDGWRTRARVDGRLAFAGVLEAGRVRGDVVLALPEVRLPPPARAGVQDPGPARDISVVHRLTPARTFGRPPRRTPDLPAALRAARDPAVALTIRSAQATRVRAQGFDAQVELGPGFRAVRAAGAWLLFGDVEVRGGSIDLAASRLPLLAGSRLRFTGAADTPYVALDARPELAAPGSVVALRGPWDEVQVGLVGPGEAPGHAGPAAGAAQQQGTGSGVSPEGSTGPEAGHGRDPDAARRPVAIGGRPHGVPAQKALAAVGRRFPFGALLGLGPPAGSFDAGTAVTGRVRIGATERVAADPFEGEAAHVGRVELRLGPSTGVQGSVAGSGDFSADLLWSHER